MGALYHKRVVYKYSSIYTTRLDFGGFCVGWVPVLYTNHARTRGATPYHPQNTPPLIPRICSDLLRSPYRYYEKLEKSLSPGDTG